ncbi:sporulation protein [Candidatus Uhrbacteria bacterium]|nr:sporulation protein [Candidatus Uhrbacteria bacterium]
MGFFDKVKQSLNIGGAKLTIQAPPSVQNGGTLSVKVSVEGGKMAQTIKGVVVKCVEKETWTENQLGGGSKAKWRTTTLAQAGGGNGFAIQPGEKKDMDFSLSVQTAAEPEQGGAMGMLNKLNSLATRRKKEWELRAEAEIEGSTVLTQTASLTVTM